MKPIDETKLPVLRLGNKHADENLFLHCLLNHHLHDGDQLPVSGSGANDFGPRTLAKVKRFQEVNKIDIGEPDFKDGVVGPHTWDKLLEKQTCTVTALAMPPPVPPIPPILPPVIMPPLTFPQFQRLPPPIPVPKLEISGQFQIGEQGQFPTSGKATAAHSIQVVAVFLNKNDKDSFHIEGQVGPSIALNRGDPNGSKTDLGINVVLNLANLPGSGKRFTWSVPMQLQLIKSLNSRRPPAGQVSAAVQASLNVIKIGDLDAVQVTTSLGGFLQMEPPSDFNEETWKVSGGLVTFFGFSGSFFAF